MVQLVNPVGDFPLDDDWSSAFSVEHLLREGQYRIISWMSSTLIVQALWGALFCLLTGFSFTALRFSTLILGLIGVFATYSLLREVKANRMIAFIGALIILTNPLYFLMSHTFRTDVPFFTFAILSFLFFIRSLNRDTNYDMLFGTLLGCAATLIRQPGIIVPIAFASAYFVKYGINKKTLLKALAPAALAIFSLIIYYLWLKLAQGFTYAHNPTYMRFIENFSKNFFEHIIYFIKNVTHSFVYLGLFLLPLLVPLTGYQWKISSNEQRRFITYTSIVFFVIIVAILLLEKEIMPFFGNILYNFGLGARTLRDSFFLKYRYLPQAPPITWHIITTIGVVGAVLLLQNIFLNFWQIFNCRKKRNSTANTWVTVFAFCVCFLYISLISVTRVFDRYLIFLLPMLMVLVVCVCVPFERYKFSLKDFFAISFLIVYAIFSTMATHDYLSWNRARWDALHNLVINDNVSHKDIDGGYEFNGWFGYNPKQEWDHSKSWWWVENDDYVITFGPIPNYNEIKRYHYRRWLPQGDGYIFVLQKQSVLRTLE